MIQNWYLQDAPIGHRQVTDAYLAHLARSYSARLATFDQALTSPTSFQPADDSRNAAS